MKYPHQVFLCLLCMCACLIAQGQIGTPSYFAYDMQINLPDASHVAPWELNNKKIKLEAGKQIRLIPPDMAMIDPSRILSIQTDTLTARSGPAPCISVCLLDTFYVSKYLFLTDVRVEVPFFEDGTYEGVSSMGWEALESAAVVQAPENTRPGGVLRLADVNPANLTFPGRIRALQELDLESIQGFPFQSGDIDEIRLIKCNPSPQVLQSIYYLEDMLHQQPSFCRSPSVDPRVAPVSAVARISNPVTVRYFHTLHEIRAEALAETISWMFTIPMSDILIEDMQPYYAGNPPVKDYLEVWFN